MHKLDTKTVDMYRLAEEIRQSVKDKADKPSPTERDELLIYNIDINPGHFETLLSELENASQAKTSLPKKLDRFPLNRSKSLQNLILKIYNLLFREQRAINAKLVTGLREALRLNYVLQEQLRILQINDTFLKTELTQYRNSLANLTGSEYAKSVVNLTPYKPVLENSHDALYAAFEDRFRGSRQEIASRLRVYLPFVKEAGIGTEAMGVLDLGSGRGEWLELLRSNDLCAEGVDSNSVLVGQCREKGLLVTHADALQHLLHLPDNCIGGITGFHIVEHLSFETLLELFDQSLRALRPNGMVIFETPNPANILVGSHSFFMDPTHQRPLPMELLKFLLESRGFSIVKILQLHPYPDSYHVEGGTVAQTFNQYFYGPQDYAVIARKI